MEPINSTPPVSTNQPPSLVPPKPQPKSGDATKTPLMVAIAALAVALVLGGVLVVVSQKAARAEKAAADQTAKVQSVEKRMKAIEEQETYTEKQVDRNKYQAVFLSTGQVYFGKITDITSDTMKLEEIFYLKSGSVDKNGEPVAGTETSLIKLGNELHGPEDVMYIERKNLTFWENLKPDGQVTKAIKAYINQNK